MSHSDDFPLMMEREAGLPANVPPVAVAFGMHAMLDGDKTSQAGHEIYKDVEFVKIAIPGDGKSLYFQPATKSHRNRFPQAYAAFKQRDVKPIEGMPIENWAPISRSLALTLKSMHVHTVEALAAISDTHIEKIGVNGRELRAKAQAWLQEAKEGAAATKLAAENQSLRDQLAGMQAQIDALQLKFGSAMTDEDASIAVRKARKSAA